MAESVDNSLSSGIHLPNEEYEMQCMGILPTSVMDEIVGFVEGEVRAALEEVEENLSKVPESILCKKEFNSGMNKLRSTVMKRTVKILTRLEEHMLHEVLKVPQYLLLPTDIEHTRNVTLADVDRLSADIEDLHTQLRNEHYCQAALTEELQRGKTFLEHQEKVMLEFFPVEIEEASDSIKEDFVASAACVQQLSEEMERFRTNIDKVSSSLLSFDAIESNRTNFDSKSRTHLSEWI